MNGEQNLVNDATAAILVDGGMVTSHLHALRFDWEEYIECMYVCIYAVLSKRKHAHLVGRRKRFYGPTIPLNAPEFLTFKTITFQIVATNEKNHLWISLQRFATTEKEPQKIPILLGIATRYPYL